MTNQWRANNLQELEIGGNSIKMYSFLHLTIFIMTLSAAWNKVS